MIPCSTTDRRAGSADATGIHDPSERLRCRRRAFLGSSATGLLGSIALAWLDAHAGSGGRSLQAAETARPFGPHFTPRAERIICLFQNGGPSQMDLFDPKPELSKYDGKPYPGEKKVETLAPSRSGNLMGSPFAFRPAGASGLLLSELLPYTAAIADDITLIRSMQTESVCHETALRIAHSGHPLATDRPALGAWLTYGLGSLNQNLPTFVVLPDPAGLPINGTLNWSAGWLPAQHQGTPFNIGEARCRCSICRRLRACRPLRGPVNWTSSAA
jgi:hypothetical protein